MATVLAPDALSYDPHRELSVRDNAVALLFASLAAGLINPGVLLGALAVLPFQRRVSRSVSLLVAGSLACLAWYLRSAVLLAWPWRMTYGMQLQGWFPSLSPLSPNPAITHSIAVEALVGPFLLQVCVLALSLLNQSIIVQLRIQRKSAKRRQLAASQPASCSTDQRHDHPRGAIRLGLDVERKVPVDLEPHELSEHVFIPGASGSGKTTTLVRLAEGALQLGWGVVILDCKGGDLGDVARRLALSADVPFLLVDPDDPDSLGYDPCTGDSADITNKLVGAFSYQDSAEIYKLVAMRVLPILVRGLVAAGRQITLNELALVLGNDAEMRRLGRDAGPPLDKQLTRIAEEKGVAEEGHKGLFLRFGALSEGKFGSIFRAKEEGRPLLGWDEAFAAPSVTYIALRATAASEDVELMGRIVAQDLKQLCARRLRTMRAGATLHPVLFIIDEFAALREAEQFVDLLLQARQALVPTVLSTQYVPESVKIRKAALGAGLIISHRVESDDAKVIADQSGTQHQWIRTVQTGIEGATGMGSVREGEAYHIHPNVVRSLQRGRVAMRSVPGNRHCIVEVHKSELSEG